MKRSRLFAVKERRCIYWARLADVRILTEIYQHKPRIYASPATLVGYFSPGSLSTNGPWRQLDGTPYYALPLNLDAATGEHTAQH